ncbi:MAG TPA: thioredoxin domain-containing protein [Ignavibacteriaceae bacterium]|nr:thioredoxin domain-containing protein [Ignavibacteriaceae bacterium]
MKIQNKLTNESSPYLLQHANNPVDWYPWGSEALDKAKSENKLVIISIGYAACHWCHVMEHESFEDESVARVMNDFYVSIKVDREERPDVDQIYMDAAHLITGRGGWPLNVIALPDGRPVFAGTYFRKNDWTKILLYFKDLYLKEPETFNTEAEKLTNAIKSIKVPGLGEGKSSFTKEDLDEVFNKIISYIDFENGGTRGAPKFPMPSIHQFLLTYNFHIKNPKALEAVTTTLDKMADGGIYDHIGGGFARYSTDDIWKVPHFEKMLYDNAELVSLYSHAYKVTGNDLYKKVVYETLDFIEREMTDESGGFYSSLDADSEGEEGKYYVWTKEEIENLLGKSSELFCDYYSISSIGNWEGNNILFITQKKEDLSKKYQISEELFDRTISESKKILFDERNKRIRPGLDDKILTSWNSLMLRGYVDAYAAFGEKKFLEAAVKNGEFILNNMMSEDGRLNRNYKNGLPRRSTSAKPGKSNINAFLDDYAYTIEALISLYEATFDEKWIHNAKRIADYVLLHFKDEHSDFFFYTSDLDDPLIARKIDFSDNVTPSSNSSLAEGLFKLSKFFYKDNYEELAGNLVKSIKNAAVMNPTFHSYWLFLAVKLSFRFYELGVVGENYEKEREKISKHFFPNIVLFGSRKESSLKILENRYVKGKTLVYVCENRTCQLPAEDFESVIVQISQK